MSRLTLAQRCLTLLILGFAISCDRENDPVTVNRSITPNDFLSATSYKSLVVQIVSVDGFGPTAVAVENLVEFLNARLNKPSGITVVQRTVPSSGSSSITVEQLRSIEGQQRTEHTSGSRITAYVYFADAGYSGNNGNLKTLGVAYDNSSMAIFEESIREFSGGIGQPSIANLESAVMLHEVAHILGLVNTGTPMVEQHQDVAHGHHCTNEDCLMYYLAETSGIAANLFGGEVPGLDAKCLADLKANGGR